MPIIKTEYAPHQTKTMRHFSVSVPAGTKEILIQGDYHPKVVEDHKLTRDLIVAGLKRYMGEDIPESKLEAYGMEKFAPSRNLFNYTLVDPKRQIRARGNNRFFEPVQVSEEQCSLGCVVGPISPGEWDLIIEAHAIVSDCVKVEMTVTLNNEVSSGIASTIRRQEDEKQHKPVAVNPQLPAGKGWYVGDFHVHSHHSDGSHPVSEMIETLRDWGYDFFILTDHNTTVGWDEEYNRQMLVIPGMEVTTFHGHAVVVDWLGDFDFLTLEKEDDFKQRIAQVHNKGGLFQVSHPYSVGDPICTGCRWEYDNLDWDSVDMMEVWAGSWYERRFENRRALARWEELLNQGKQIVAVSGTDTHRIRENPGDFGRTYVLADDYSKAGIMAGLKKRNVFISSGPLLDFRLEAEGVEHAAIMGDEVKVAMNGEVTLQAEITDLLVDCRIQLVKQGEVVSEEACLPGKNEFQWQEKITKDCWFNLRVMDKHDRLVALSNPIFISLS